mgnify:CR=1 FL=1
MKPDVSLPCALPPLPIHCSQAAGSDSDGEGGEGGGAGGEDEFYDTDDSFIDDAELDE